MNDFIRVELIDAYMKENNLTIEEFARMCGVYTFTIEDLFNNNCDYEIEVIKRIAFNLSIPIIDMFRFN